MGAQHVVSKCHLLLHNMTKQHSEVSQCWPNARRTAGAGAGVGAACVGAGAGFPAASAACAAAESAAYKFGASPAAT